MQNEHIQTHAGVAFIAENGQKLIPNCGGLNIASDGCAKPDPACAARLPSGAAFGTAGIDDSSQ